MNFLKEIKFEETKVLYSAELENGVHIDIYGDYALGSDGKTYYYVGFEDEEGVLQTWGWSCDIDGTVIL